MTNRKTPKARQKMLLAAGLAPLHKHKHYVIESSQLVGESVSHDIKSKAVWSVLLGCLLMFIFIFIRFRGWQYGLGAVVALFHDALMIMAVFTLFKNVFLSHLEVNQDFIAAILTVMSYSMTDTVVVFDRIREYLTKKKKRDLDKERRQNRSYQYCLECYLKPYY